jgi:glycerol dehydrogenase-like iron-containing ADH family enzyme
MNGIGIGDSLPDDESLVARLRGAGVVDTVFVIADNDAIGRRAPHWARLMAGIGWSHRVRFWEGRADAASVAALADEAGRFGGQVIVAAGAGATLAVARDVALAAGIPCVVDAA